MNPAPHKIFSMVACIAAFVSAAIYGGYFCIARSLPIYRWNGDIGFTISNSVWLMTIGALMISVLSAVFLIASCLIHRHKVLSLLNIATLVFLIPSTYTVSCLFMLFLR